MNPNNPLSTMLWGLKQWVKLLLGKPPTNVGPVEEPFNQIMSGADVFGPEVDGLVRELAAHTRFSIVRRSVIDMLWAGHPQFGHNNKAELKLILTKYRDRLNSENQTPPLNRSVPG